jgi:large subunit ribosomal protein L32
MAVPKKKISKSRRNQRRSHDKIEKINLVVDSKTGEYKLPHHISLKDGYYNGKKLYQTREEKRLEKARQVEETK